VIDFVMTPEGKRVTKLTRTKSVTESAPAWSPDGSYLAFVACRECTTSDLYVMNADGSGVTRVTEDAALDGGSAWSPDGKTLAYHSDATGQWSEQAAFVPALLRAEISQSC
jgi:Tol biopolymer transport system component